jgi:hypothetical protein
MARKRPARPAPRAPSKRTLAKRAKWIAELQARLESKDMPGTAVWHGGLIKVRIGERHVHPFSPAHFSLAEGM